MLKTHTHTNGIKKRTGNLDTSPKRQRWQSSIWKYILFIICHQEIQIKTMRYHHTPIRMAKIQLTHQMLASMWSNREGCLHCWWEWKMVQPPWKTVWQFLPKLNTLVPYDAAILLLGIYPEELKMYVCTKIYTWMYTAALYIIAKYWK